MVVGEDSAALIGILIAATGIALRQFTGSVYPDAIASMLIGVILCSVGGYLIGQVRHLLVGESADRTMIRRVRQIVQRTPGVKRLRHPRSMHLGPEEVMLNLDVELEPELTAEDVARTVDEIEHAIQDEFPEISRIYIEARDLSETRAT